MVKRWLENLFHMTVLFEPPPSRHHQVCPVVWPSASSLQMQPSLRWSPPSAWRGSWGTTPCGVWPRLCTRPSCPSQTPSQVCVSNNFLIIFNFCSLKTLWVALQVWRRLEVWHWWAEGSHRRVSPRVLPSPLPSFPPSTLPVGLQRLSERNVTAFRPYTEQKRVFGSRWLLDHPEDAGHVQASHWPSRVQLPVRSAWGCVCRRLRSLSGCRIQHWAGDVTTELDNSL